MKGPKLVAFYLPQFHTIPENDKWWGKGFTEWTNVKKSTPQFKGHKQPELPINSNFYDLSDVNVMKEQAKMAKGNGIDAFCYYHYWFEGKLLLEKPLENMLGNKAVDIDYCFCWANETWARTWDGSETDILIKQNYNENDDQIKEHFDYLLQFFKDDRYIKVDNKPMFVIYKPHLINNLREVMKIWDDLAKSEGFDGIYWGYQHYSAFNQNLKGFLFNIQFEPFYTIKSYEYSKNRPLRGISVKIEKGIKRVFYSFKGAKLSLGIWNYDWVWKRIINRKKNDSNENCISFPGAFPAWDNTPRRGDKAMVLFEATPQKFKRYFKTFYEKNKDSEFIFINAWNEWAEGAHLEPDEINGYGYLEAIRDTVCFGE